MKRWLPPLFIAVALLANFIEHVLYTKFLESWTPDAVHLGSRLLGFISLFGVPASLLLFWSMWRPSPKCSATIGRNRRWFGNVLFALTVLLWIRYMHGALFYGWAAATPVSDPQALLRQSGAMYVYAQLIMPVGGLLSLWLKGIRIPPRNGGELK